MTEKREKKETVLQSRLNRFFYSPAHPTNCFSFVSVFKISGNCRKISDRPVTIRTVWFGRVPKIADDLNTFDNSRTCNEKIGIVNDFLL